MIVTLVTYNRIFTDTGDICHIYLHQKHKESVIAIEVMD